MKHKENQAWYQSYDLLVAQIVPFADVLILLKFTYKLLDNYLNKHFYIGL